MLQRHRMSDERGKALLTDIVTEKMSHLEIISTMIHQLSDFNSEEIKKEGICPNLDLNQFTNFNLDINFSENNIAAIENDIALEERAKTVYENLMDLTNDPDVLAPLAFLRQRKIVHCQRLKELRNTFN